MNKEKIAEIFEKISELLEIKGDNLFKIRAYLNASRVISQFPGNIEDAVLKGEMSKIPGIGKDIASKIEELVKTGRLIYYEELKKSVPEGIFELLKLRGLGPKKTKILYEKLGIKNIADLKTALEDKKLLYLDGFGEKTVSNLTESIKEYNNFKERYLYPEAQLEAGLIISYLLEAAGSLISNIEIAGSLRRKLETVGDIDIVIASKSSAIAEVFLKYDKIAHIESNGDTKISIVLENGMRVDLRIVPPEDYIYALHHFTGSKLHNEELRSREKKHGYKINEYGIYKTEYNKIIVADEKDFYNVFNMQFIPPELREGAGEIEEALKHDIPELINIKDIRGVFHVHTSYTDGKESLEEMVKTALELGFEYIGITDHSVSAPYAHGLSADELNSEIEHIDRLNKQYEGKITILKGIESDILENGDLDYGNETLSKLDFVIASVHSRFNMHKEDMTARIMKAIKNPYTTMLGHLTGRLLLERKEYEVNISAVIDTLSEYKTIVELNANPKRLDIDWRYIKEAISKSVMLSINPDAHNKKGFDVIEYGVNAARKGWTTKNDVLNTYGINEVLNKIKTIREYKLNKSV
ncbi:MAG: DNA polymerase/3'-5' exonuclease PolX [Candidatus Acididesulfobacter guangdongensis]|uniref:DNA-directed DNA polymerase n=1 Tax=Acididesulfobacter guangdongensis TaxID=2597225 RepID=A0A519BJJ6_ACIG2|nr:MAG: DNA polymerase/3'-5' exonuclease PolX [Candidatus Acididesulfobacter guangdongensis]